MCLFRNDAEEIFEIKGITYSKRIADQVILYFNKRMYAND